MSFGGVLDHEQAVALRDRHHRPHVYRMAIEMNHDDGLGPGRDSRLDQIRVHVPGRRLAVDEDRGGAAVAHGVRGSDERQGRHDDFVTGTDLEGKEGEVESDGSIGA